MKYSVKKYYPDHQLIPNCQIMKKDERISNQRSALTFSLSIIVLKTNYCTQHEKMLINDDLYLCNLYK